MGGKRGRIKNGKLEGLKVGKGVWYREIREGYG